MIKAGPLRKKNFFKALKTKKKGSKWTDSVGTCFAASFTYAEIKIMTHPGCYWDLKLVVIDKKKLQNTITFKYSKYGHSKAKISVDLFNVRSYTTG